jgi:hypothetical protein
MKLYDVDTFDSNWSMENHLNKLEDKIDSKKSLLETLSKMTGKSDELMAIIAEIKDFLSEVDSMFKVDMSLITDEEEKAKLLFNME